MRTAGTHSLRCAMLLPRFYRGPVWLAGTHLRVCPARQPTCLFALALHARRHAAVVLSRQCGPSCIACAVCQCLPRFNCCRIAAASVAGMLGCECFCDFGFGVNLAPACLCGESERLRINTVSVTARPLLAVELRATCGTPAESKLVPPRFRRFKRRWLDLFA